MGDATPNARPPGGVARPSQLDRFPANGGEDPGVLDVAFVGNFQPDLPPGVRAWSTETHLAASLELLGHRVRRLQEGQVRAVEVPDRAGGADLLVWTQTQGLADTGGTAEDRAWMVAELRRRGVPTLGVHLDRWWGLDREWRISAEPYFCLDLLATADGDHDDQWESVGVRHLWSPPGVFGPDCVPGMPRPEYRADVAFVGGWRGYGHAEWRPRRAAMIRAVERRYGRRFACWPRTGEPAIRGQDLNDLYASTTVVVGDSCLVSGPGRYVSDRVPETWGRGGFLLHPWTPYVGEAYPMAPTWPLGDHEALTAAIDYYLDHPDAREECRVQVHAHVVANHTYEHRMARILRVMVERGLLPAGGRTHVRV